MTNTIDIKILRLKPNERVYIINKRVTISTLGITLKASFPPVTIALNSPIRTISRIFKN